MNSIQLSGWVKKVKFSADGTPRAFFTVNSKGQGKTQDGKQKYDNFPCILWGKQAENFERLVKDGDALDVSGRVELRRVTNVNTGAQETKFEVSASAFSWAPQNREAEQGNEEIPF